MFLVVVPRALPYCSIIILDFGYLSLTVLSVLSSLNVAARAGDDFICAERDALHAINERNSKQETRDERDNDVDTRIAVQIGRYRAHLSIIIPYSYCTVIPWLQYLSICCTLPLLYLPTTCRSTLIYKRNESALALIRSASHG